MTEPVKTRTYRSAVRAERAAGHADGRARRRRRLFAASGFAGTTVAAVARTAGVSVDTVYASGGASPSCSWPCTTAPWPAGATARRPRSATTWAASGPPVRRRDVALYARALAERLPHSVPLAEALRDAAVHDPACRRVWEGLEARRRAGMLALAGELRATGGLRCDLDDDEVAQRLWMTNAPEYYRLATTGGRGPEAYAAHVADVWARTLLA